MRRILVDVDGVLADLVSGLCMEAAEFGYSMTPDHVTHYKFEDCLHVDKVRVFKKAMARTGFCAGLSWYPGAKAFAFALVKSGAEITAVTAPYPDASTWAHERTAWLKSAGITRVVHTWCKEIVKGDVLIEDNPDHLVAWGAENPEGYGLLIDRPWNRAAPPRGWVRCRNYSEAWSTVESVLREPGTAA